MSEPQTLEDVFEGEEAEVITEEPTEAKAEEAKGEKAAPPAEEEAKSEGKSEKSEDEAFKAMALDERRKRQELEEKLKKYEEQEAKVEIPDPVENPEAYAAFMDDKQNKALIDMKISLSRDLMSSNGDYEAMEKTFIEMTKENPFLIQQMRASPNPAKFAYDKAKEHTEIMKLKDPSYKERLEAEIREKVLAELKEQEPKKSKVTVPDLTNATSAKSGHDDVMEDSLESLTIGN